MLLQCLIKINPNYLRGLMNIHRILYHEVAQSIARSIAKLDE